MKCIYSLFYFLNISFLQNPLFVYIKSIAISKYFCFHVRLLLQEYTCCQPKKKFFKLLAKILIKYSTLKQPISKQLHLIAGALQTCTCITLTIYRWKANKLLMSVKESINCCYYRPYIHTMYKSNLKTFYNSILTKKNYKINLFSFKISNFFESYIKRNVYVLFILFILNKQERQSNRN